MEISEHETLWLQSTGAKMITDLGIELSHKVIDFGSGQGRYSIPLSQVVGKEGKVYSFERDEKEISIFKSRISYFSKEKNISIHTENINELKTPIANNTIDSILIFDVLQYIENWDQLFKNFHRILKPNGYIHIYPAAIPHPNSVDIEEAGTKLKKLGFEYHKSTTYRMMHNIDMVDDIVYSFCLCKNI